MRRLIVVAAAVLVLLGAGAGWKLYSSREVDRGELDISIWRRDMEDDGAKVNERVGRHVPAGVASRLDVNYDPADPEALLDVFYPADAAAQGRKLPTVVWVHGGGWISGSKNHVANYLRLIASRGFTVVGVDYPLAPAQAYPAALRQINKSLAFLRDSPPVGTVDASRLFLAGDSAGAQIAAELAGIISEPSHAEAAGFAPGIDRQYLKGIVLFCGVYDMELAFKDLNPRRLTKIMRAYFADKDFLTVPRFRHFSVLQTITPKFPPIFVTVGNADALNGQARRLVEAAKRNNVPVESLLFEPDYKPALGHEYQWQMDLEAAWLALERSVAFMLGVLR